MHIMDFVGKRAWKFRPSLQWLRQHDCGHAVSIGFVLGEDITERQLQAFIRQGTAFQVDYEQANHARPW